MVNFRTRTSIWLVGHCVFLTVLAIRAHAADSEGVAMPSWSGFYVGGHLGYAWGDSHWTIEGPGAEATSGTFGFFRPFDPFKGTGSYFAGLQAGYNYRLPQGVVIGFEADFQAPNTLMGERTIASPSVGQASFSKTVEMSGTLRGRLGLVQHGWLLYGTAGYAWSYEQFLRTQLAGGTTTPDSTEKATAFRNGLALGAGIEFPVAVRWTAHVEYLFTALGAQTVTFPSTAQRFDSDLSAQSLRIGLNYQFGEGADRADGPTAPKSDQWSVHGQTTFTQQYAFPFRAPYRGPNSLDPNSGRETWDAVFYLGWRLWPDAELWVNPEIDQGFGLSSTFGVAGFTSGEAYKVGANFPYARLPRYFIRQTIGLCGETEKLEDAPNQLAGTQQANRLVITAGKIATTDIFDTNRYAHDPRADFLNWARRRCVGLYVWCGGGVVPGPLDGAPWVF